MLTLRPEQIEVLRAAMLESYMDRTVKHLSKVFPDAVGELLGPEGQDDKVREFIGVGIKKAEHFDIKSERNATLFIDLMMGYSPDFYRQRNLDWVGRVLDKKDLTETEKMDMIFQQLQAKEKAAEQKKN